MKGFSPILPLQKDNEEGYLMYKNALDSIKHDFKCLLLTNQGERMMIPSYGVGLKKFLFQQDTRTVYQEIKSAIIKQAAEFMPFLEIQNIDIFDAEDTNNTIVVKISYYVSDSAVLQQINLEVGAN